MNISATFLTLFAVMSNVCVVDVISMKHGFHESLASVKIDVACNHQLLGHFPEFRVGVFSGVLGGQHKLRENLEKNLIVRTYAI